MIITPTSCCELGIPSLPTYAILAHKVATGVSSHRQKAVYIPPDYMSRYMCSQTRENLTDNKQLLSGRALQSSTRPFSTLR